MKLVVLMSWRADYEFAQRAGFAYTGLDFKSDAEETSNIPPPGLCELCRLARRSIGWFLIPGKRVIRGGSEPRMTRVFLPLTL